MQNIFLTEISTRLTTENGSSSGSSTSELSVTDDVSEGSSTSTGSFGTTIQVDVSISTAGSDSTARVSSTSTEPTTPEKLPEPPVRFPPVVDYPYYTTPKAPRKRPERVSSETSEIVALIIGIIAGSLIAVILIILVILKFKSRGDRSYKVDDSKGFQQGPNAALLGNQGGTNGQTPFTMNGALRNGDRGQVPKKKRDSKDIKEWYV